MKITTANQLITNIIAVITIIAQPILSISCLSSCSKAKAKNPTYIRKVRNSFVISRKKSKVFTNGLVCHRYTSIIIVDKLMIIILKPS